MFRDMGELPAASYDGLVAASRAQFAEAIPAGRYHGWLAVRTDRPEEVVAGAGPQPIGRLPRPAAPRRLLRAAAGHAFAGVPERPRGPPPPAARRTGGAVGPARAPPRP